MQNQIESGAAPLPSVQRKRLAGLRKRLGSTKAAAAALGLSYSTFARAEGGLALRPGSHALVKAGLEKLRNQEEQ